jgi:hypothetical protein
MAKKNFEDSDTFADSQETAAATSVPTVDVLPKITVKAPRLKVYAFEQWAKLRGKPERHLRGMKAFLGTNVGNKYPLEKWDELFKAY